MTKKIGPVGDFFLVSVGAMIVLGQCFDDWLSYRNGIWPLKERALPVCKEDEKWKRNWLCCVVCV